MNGAIFCIGCFKSDSIEELAEKLGLPAYKVVVSGASVTSSAIFKGVAECLEAAQA